MPTSLSPQILWAIFRFRSSLARYGSLGLEGAGMWCGYSRSRARDTANPTCRPPSKPAQKPHIAGEAVTVHYRFHRLGGACVSKLHQRSHRGEPLVVVAGPDGRRYRLPLWMTDPAAAQWDLRDIPRLSLSALRDLVTTFSNVSAPPETGDRDGIPQARQAAETPAVRPAATDQPTGERETRSGCHSGDADCRGDGEHGSDCRRGRQR